MSEGSQRVMKIPTLTLILSLRERKYPPLQGEGQGGDGLTRAFSDEPS